DDNGEGLSGSSRLDQASLRLAAAQEQGSADDPQEAALPELMAALDEQEHRMIRNRYLRRPPLSPYQLRKAMGGLELDQLDQLEQQALDKMRLAAVQLSGELAV
ncbi:MAG: RNA polymerase subunit sigma-70, partial [Bacteroidota bacterium]